MALQPTTTAIPVSSLLDRTYAQADPAVLAAQQAQVDALAQAYAAAYAANPAMFKAPYDYTFNLSSNKGNPTGDVGVSANTPIALIDNRTGELVYSGVGVDAAKQVEALAADLTNAGGRKADWSIYTAPAGATSADQFTLAAHEKPNQSTLGLISDIAMPVLGAALALPTGGLSLGAGLSGALGSAAAAGALGAAGGSALSSALQGRSLENTLLRAALAGAGSAAGGALMGQLTPTSAVSGGATTGAATQAGTSLGGNIVGSVAAPTANQIVVTPTLAALGSTLGAGAGGLSSAALTKAIQSASDNWQQLNTTDAAGPIYVTSPAPTTPIGAAAPPLVSVDPVTGENVMNVTQSVTKPPVTDTTGATVGSIGGTLPTMEEILVTPKQDLGPGSLTGALAGIGAGTAATGGTFTQKPSLLDDILKYYGIAAPILGGAADLLGGGSGTAGGTAAPYVSLLGPAPNLGRGALTPFTGDYEKYAFGPEWNFFGGQKPA